MPRGAAPGHGAGGNALFRHGSVGIEMLMLAACGYGPREVLAAATSEAARALGLERVTGAIRPGLAADLLVVDGDPLQDLRVLAPGAQQRIAGVVAAGRFVRWDGQDLI
ncbi:MAG: amidohydrolase family protein [Firmicutes bacterium]|nr:amidohydrolase family protein [Bacillota bacterium]